MVAATWLTVTRAAVSQYGALPDVFACAVGLEISSSVIVSQHLLRGET
jgi:hypothetical protein